MVKGKNKSALQTKQFAKKRSKKNSKVSRKFRNAKQRKKQKLKTKEKAKQKRADEAQKEADLEEAEEFFGQNANVAKSFAGVDLTKKERKKRKRAAKAIEENRKRRKLEEANSEDELSDLEDWERGVRKPKSWDTSTKSKRLPIKTKSGELRAAPDKEIKEEEFEEESSEEQEVKKIDPKKRRADIRLQIATVSQQLISNSEQKVARLGNLVKFCQDKDKVVQQWAMLSLTEIFRNILPGYRINTKLLNQPTDKLSKQVKQVRKFESTLIKHWSKFVFFLLKKVNMLRNRKNPKDKVCLTAFSCVCKVFTYAHHFNLSKEMMKTMVEFLNHKNEELRNSWSKTFREVLKSNNMNTVMLEAIREVIKAIRKRDYKVEPEMVSILISLPLRNMEKPTRKKIIVKGKKQKDKEKQLKLDLEEGNAFANREKVYKIHTEILEMVFEVAFTILRMGGINDPLLPIALQLLTKHSRLANLEIVLDMIASLGSLAEELPFESFLRATLCTFVMLEGRGRALEIDLQNFYTIMYERMWEILVNLEHGQIFVEALKMMLKVKSISKLRVAAFLKRILSISIQIPSNLSQQLLELAFFLFSRHLSSLSPMLEKESDGGEIFNALEKIPDVSNAKNSKLWELPLLQTSYHLPPAVLAAQMVEANGPIQPMKLEAKKVFKSTLLKNKTKSESTLKNVKAVSTDHFGFNFKKDFASFEGRLSKRLYSLVDLALSRGS